MSVFSLRFLVRDGCHLCEDAAPAVERVARQMGLELQVIDIDGDDGLVKEYGLRIPVVLAPDDTVLAEGHIRRKHLEKVVKQRTSGSTYRM